MCLSLFLINLKYFKPVTSLKRDANTGVFLWILWNVYEQLFYRTTPMAASEHQTNEKNKNKIKVLSTYKEPWRGITWDPDYWNSWKQGKNNLYISSQCYVLYRNKSFVLQGKKNWLVWRIKRISGFYMKFNTRLKLVIWCNVDLTYRNWQ